MSDSAFLYHMAHAALAGYDLRDAGVHLLSISENVIFRVDTGGRPRYALRLHRPGYHTAAEIGSELAWLGALHEAGLEVPVPVPGHDGALIRTLPAPDGITRHAVLFTWMDGTEPTPDIDPIAFTRLGRVTARLHDHSRYWARAPGFTRKVWTPDTMTGPHALWGRWDAVPGMTGTAHDLIAACLRQINAELAEYGRQPERFGLIHADLRLANLLVSGAHTRLIDFDDCGISWFMQDLAAALSFHEDHPHAPRCRSLAARLRDGGTGGAGRSGYFAHACHTAANPASGMDRHPPAYRAGAKPWAGLVRAHAGSVPGMAGGPPAARYWLNRAIHGRHFPAPGDY
ncbi:phosphotransferase enzyme family protein [Komagataeibacter kakiaceti]|uniref:phosphotransferase enzyme family protein n=1 Tax=Komagataeibacter kakiaceti TaxID=943261 RepID=UPI000A78B2F6|nr:phosphotransferase [Komagataeibacter kakiaceti]